jgi:hypothetical protein
MINHEAKLKTTTIDITMIAITPPLTGLVFEGLGSSCPDGVGVGVGVGGFLSAHNPS